MSAFANKRSNDGGEEEPSSKSQKTVGSSLDDVDVKQIMASDGPVVSCVILRADGSQEEIKLDTSPRKRQAEDFLGGACTMLGEWSEQMVVLIARQDYEDASQSLSQHKLQPPFHAYKIHGDILLMKLGEDSTPLNYTLTEYTEFQQLEIEEWLLPSEDEEEDGEEDEDGSDDGSDADFAEHLFLQLVDKFVSDHKGREPTKDELVVIEAQVQDMISDMATNNDDEDDDSGSDEEEDEDEGDGEFGSDDDDDDDEEE